MALWLVLAIFYDPADEAGRSSGNFILLELVMERSRVGRYEDKMVSFPDCFCMSVESLVDAENT